MRKEILIRKYASLLCGFPSLLIHETIRDKDSCYLNYSDWAKLVGGLSFINFKNYIRRLNLANFIKIKQKENLYSFITYDLDFLDVKKILKCLSKGFESSWNEDEFRHCDWEFLFNNTKMGNFSIDSYEIYSIIIARVAGRPGGGFRIVLNDKYFLESTGRLKTAKRYSSMYKFSIDKKLKPLKLSYKKSASNKIKVKEDLTFRDKEVTKWKDKDFMDFAVSLNSNDNGAFQLLTRHAMKRGIIKNGVRLLGKALSIEKLSKSKEEYKKFLEWLVCENTFKLMPGHFVSTSMFYLYIIKNNLTEDDSGCLEPLDISINADEKW